MGKKGEVVNHCPNSERPSDCKECPQLGGAGGRYYCKLSGRTVSSRAGSLYPAESFDEKLVEVRDVRKPFACKPINSPRQVASQKLVRAARRRRNPVRRFFKKITRSK